MKSNYQLDGAGWASATVGDGVSNVEITASYLGDALGDLLRATESLLQGDTEARCSWEEEPGEYRWLFTSDGGDVDLQILRLPDNFPPLADSEGVEIFRTSESLSSVAADIADAAQRLLDEYGEAGYLRLWGRHSFPIESLRGIRRLLAGRTP